MIAAPVLVELRGVDVTLGGRRALAGVDWQLRSGEHWAVLGANGAGKSTFLRLIAGELWPDPRAGTRFYRLSAAAPDPVRIAKSRIAYVSPESAERHIRLGFDLSGHELVASGLFGGDYVAERLSDSQRAAIDAIFSRLVLEHLAAKRTGELSHGELRRLLIARSLVREPAVLLLDEWSSGLDSAAREAMLGLLERTSAKVQLVIASHREDDFPAALTHAVNLAAGRIVSCGRREVHERRARARAEAVPLAAGAPIVRIRNADVYVETAHVLHDITWEIRRGEHWALEGANGSGKSTLAKLVAGSLVAVRGAFVERFGSTAHVSVWELKRRIALLSDELQTQYDQSLPVEDVVVSGFFSSIGLMRTPDSAQRDRAAVLLRELDLEPYRGRDFSRLSFGERRKVLIARALVGSPEIVIVDEIFNGLDADFHARVMDVLAQLANAGASVIVIAHHPEDVPGFITRRLVLDAGRIAAEY